MIETANDARAGSAPGDDGLWRRDDGTPLLRGVHCTVCGRVSFPDSCACPACGSSPVRPVDLTSTGVVVSRSAMSGVTVGEIRLDDGVLVLARLADDPPSIGQRARFEPVDGLIRFVADA